MKRIYHYNQYGYYCGQDIADESPLEPGIFLIPAFATDIERPTPGERQLVRFVNGEWTLEDIQKPEPEPEPTAEETKEQKITALDADYQSQFTDLVRALGLATLAENTNLITSIKADYTALKADYDGKREVINNG